jgi:hypothetical protein
LTPIYDGSSKIYSPSEVENNKFEVYGESGSFFWVVYGKRESIQTEPLKSQTTLCGDGPYKWIQS